MRGVGESRVSRVGARNAISTGKIVTLMSNDCQTIERFITQVHGLWSNPAIVMVTLALLYNVIQWSSFVGLGSVVLVVPVMATISVKLALLRKKQLEFTDVRVNIMGEIINGIRVIKVRLPTAPPASDTERDPNTVSPERLRVADVRSGSSRRLSFDARRKTAQQPWKRSIPYTTTYTNLSLQSQGDARASRRSSSRCCGASPEALRRPLWCGQFYAWEASFLDRIMQIRTEEVKIITTLAWVTACFVLVLFGLPVLVAVFAIGSYTLAGNDLNTPTVRTTKARTTSLPDCSLTHVFIDVLHSTCVDPLGSLPGGYGCLLRLI